MLCDETLPYGCVDRVTGMGHKYFIRHIISSFNAGTSVYRRVTVTQDDRHSLPSYCCHSFWFLFHLASIIALSPSPNRPGSRIMTSAALVFCNFILTGCVWVHISSPFFRIDIKTAAGFLAAGELASSAKSSTLRKIVYSSSTPASRLSRPSRKPCGSSSCPIRHGRRITVFIAFSRIIPGSTLSWPSPGSILLTHPRCQFQFIHCDCLRKIFLRNKSK